MRLFYQRKPSIDQAQRLMITAPCFPQQAIPYAAGLLYAKTYKGAWQASDYREGRDMVVRSIMSLYEGALCESERLQAATYRLLQAGLFGGTQGPVDVNNPTADIPDVPNLQGFSGQPLVPIQDSAYLVLTQIRDAIQAQGQGALDDDILAELIQIAGLLA